MYNDNMFLAVSRVSDIINILYTSKVCEGNCDDTYLKLPNIHDGQLKDNSSKLLSAHVYFVELMEDDL